MKRFIAICAKAWQRVELVVTYANIDIARDELHRQGYSIMEIHEDESMELQNSQWVFFFEVLVNGEKKNGQIKSNDIFKAYIKLVDDLHYKVLSIYSEWDLSTEDRALTTQKVKESYAVYRNLSKNETKETKKIKDEENSGEKNFFQKELTRYGNLIDNIISKIEGILLKYAHDITEERSVRLKNLISSLRQIKNITNVDKLRLISESALLKIGELEKELVEKQSDIQREEFFKETNNLLKQVGSSKRIVTEKDQVVEKLKVFLHSFFDTFSENDSKKQKEEKISENSFLYYKNIRELDIYKTKLKETKKDIFSSILHFRFKGELKTKLLLKQKLIEQNISLLKNRISKKNVPYMQIVKGISYYSDVFFYLIRSLGDLLLYSLFLYSIGYFFFDGYKILSGALGVYHTGIYFIAILSIFAFFLKQVRGIFSLFLSLFIILFTGIFFAINF